MASVVRLICPNLKCRKILSVPDSARGKKVRCRGCGMRVQIPIKATAPVIKPEPEEGEEEAAA